MRSYDVMSRSCSTCKPRAGPLGLLLTGGVGLCFYVKRL
jgi:hypothetical protein